MKVFVFLTLLLSSGWVTDDMPLCVCMCARTPVLHRLCQHFVILGDKIPTQCEDARCVQNAKDKEELKIFLKKLKNVSKDNLIQHIHVRYCIDNCISQNQLIGRYRSDTFWRLQLLIG